MPSSNRAPAVEESQPIAAVFSLATKDIAERALAAKHPSAIDLELTFQSIAISSKGIPLFTRKTEQSEMTIRLATRLTPPWKPE